jgi:hypothetical protein
MNELPPEKESDDERRRANLVLLVFFVIIVGIGVWLVNAMIDARHADECIAQRLRNCNPVETPPR